MTADRLRIEFKVLLDKVDSSAYPELYDEVINIFIDRSVLEYTTAARRAFETSQPITDDVRSLVKSGTCTITQLSPGKYTADFPTDTMYLLTARGFVTRSSKETMAALKYVEHDDIEKLLDDPFNKPRGSVCLYTMGPKGMTVYTSKDYTLSKVEITYIKTPKTLEVDGSLDFPDHIQRAIVERAVDLALENLESVRARKQ